MKIIRNLTIVALALLLILVSTNSVYGTTPGTVWERATEHAGWSARQNHVAISFNGLMWVMGGRSGALYLKDVWNTQDGINWNFVGNASWAIRDGHRAVVYDGKLWVMGGVDSSGNSKNDVWYTTNGINWTQATSSAAWAARNDFGLVSYNNKMWVFGGEYLSGYKNDVWYSTDGVSWTQATVSAGWAPTQLFGAEVYADKMWIGGGTADTNMLWYSTNGITWVQSADLPYTPTTHPSTAFYNDYLYFWGGYAGANSYVTYFNLSNWTTVIAAPAFGARSYSAGLSYNNKMWVLGGVNSTGSATNEVWKSTEDINWIDAPATVNANSSATIQYSLNSPDTTNYWYYVEVTNNYGAIEDIYVTASSGNVTYSTMGQPEGDYTTDLIRRAKTSGLKTTLATDTMYVQATVAFHGHTKDVFAGMTNLAGVAVSLQQDGTWYNTTSDANGYYSIGGLHGASSVLFRASKSGYMHIDFSATPYFSSDYEVNLYLWNTTFHAPGTTGIDGLTIKYPWYQLISSATVNIWNSTNSWATTSDANGYYTHQLANQDDTISANASKTGYVTSSNVVTSISSGSWTQAMLILTPSITLTVRAKSEVSGGYLTSFTVYADNGASSTVINTMNGTVIMNLGEGIYFISASADGYSASGRYVYLTADRTEEFTLTPYSAGGTNTSISGSISNVNLPLHPVRFIVQALNGTRYPGLAVTSTDQFSNVSIATTGTDGSAVFWMNSTIYYNLTFTGSGLNLNWSGYPLDDTYFIYAAGSGTFVTQNASSNLTNYTITRTSQPWSIQNYTNAYLTSTIGIGPMGQGVIVGVVNYIIVGAAGPVGAIVALAVMAVLGIVSWVMVLFVSMTMISLFVLIGGAGWSW